MNKSTKKLQFDTVTREKVFKRDKGKCIFCEMDYHCEGSSALQYMIKDCMHYINKSQRGLGIEQNGVTGCRYHHGLLDNGNKGLREEMLGLMREHLQKCYPDWNEKKLKYNKWKMFG